MGHFLHCMYTLFECSGLIGDVWGQDNDPELTKCFFFANEVHLNQVPVTT